MSRSVRDLLREATLTRDMVDRFLDPRAHNWATFDSELGYRPQTSTIRDGIDGCYTISHYAPSGERRTINSAEQRCRINTYGDSFTECHQVSDGETWQEILAAHLGEPIRNFGVGGYGVYQAYRRMVREEETAQACPYVIFNVFPEDHVRSIYQWRWIHIPSFRRHLVERPPSAAEASPFHCNPWAHVRLNLATGEFEERANPYPTPASLYELCDPDAVYEAFKDDFVVHAFAAQHGASDVDRDLLARAAESLGVSSANFDSPEAAAAAAQALTTESGLRASMFIFDRMRHFIEAAGKRLIVLLCYPPYCVINAIRGGPRAGTVVADVVPLNVLVRRAPEQLEYDQSFVDYLTANGFLFVDTLEKHLADFQSFRCSPEEYVQRYYIGHYSPQGNHFFAYAVKDEIVDWLDPKPPAYRAGGPSLR